MEVTHISDTIYLESLTGRLFCTQCAYFVYFVSNFDIHGDRCFSVFCRSNVYACKV